MLSRTADNLFWASRYLERADFLARVIEATQRIAVLPKAYNGERNEWTSVLIASGAHETFYEHCDEPTAENVIRYLAFDPRNPSSIRNCIECGRVNARAVRTALTAGMWSGINEAWLELKRFEQEQKARGRIDREALAHFLSYVKATSQTFDGSAYRSMLRNDAYYFTRLGMFLERADNTARLLDVKYHVLLPEQEIVGGSLDYFQWTAILRSVSALTAYHWVYRESIKPWNIADLLILRPEMPRSFVACYMNLTRFLDALAVQYGTRGVAQESAVALQQRLEKTTVQSIFQGGIHEFVTQFIEENGQLGLLIAQQYLGAE